MSETPIQDALDSVFRKRRGLDEPDDRTPEERAAEQRKNAERRLENSASAGERKAAAKRLSTAKRVLLDAVTAGLHHGKTLDANEVESLVQDVVKQLGGKNTTTAVREFIRYAADAAAEGDKRSGFRAAEDIAEGLVNAGWRPTAPATADDLDDLGPAELAARISRDRA